MYTRNPQTGTFTNSEDPDEMSHNAAFHQCKPCLSRKKRYSKKKMQYFSFNYNLIHLDIQNEPSEVYCIISGGRNHQNTKG